VERMSPAKVGKGRMSEQADKSWSPCWRVRRRSRVGQRTGRRVAAPGCHDQWVPREAQTTATGVVLEVKTVSTHRDQGRPHGGRQSCPRVQGGGMTLLGWVGVMSPTKGGKGRMSEQANKSWSPCWRARRRSKVGQRTGRRVRPPAMTNGFPGKHRPRPPGWCWRSRQSPPTVTRVVLTVAAKVAQGSKVEARPSSVGSG
jgi:hypothetical protein